MKVLLDECVPRKFKSVLIAQSHACTTVPEAGLAGKKNGELLRLAQHRFEVFVTLDKGLQYQQNMAGLNISIVIIRARSNRFADVAKHSSACLTSLESIKPGQILRIGGQE
jgi:predicted nuclease of predicted toxin-antitoxin system